MRRRCKRCATAALVVAVGALTAACGAAPPPEPVGAEEAVRIAAFDFGESELLAEIYAQALERRGLRVERLGRVGSREIVEPAMELGLIDVVPEYAGTLLSFLSLGENVPTADPAQTMHELEVALEDRGMVALDASPAQNRNAVVVTKDFAVEHGVRTVSDLLPLAATLALGGPAECPERYFCLVGLREHYGLEFASFVPMPGAEIVSEGLLAEVIDVGLLFSTDPVLVDTRLVVLDDDGGLQPAENVIPVLREDALRRWGPDLIEALDEVSARLDTVGLVGLNAEAQRTGTPPATIAAAWLDA